MSAMDHVDVDLGDRAKAPSFHQDGPLPKNLRGLQHFSGWTEHCRAAEAQLNEFQTHYSIVDMAELDARELDHVDLDSFRGEVVEQRFKQHLRFVMQEKSAVEEIDSHHAQSLLLEIVFLIEHADVDNDLAVFVPRASLVFDPHPSVALVRTLIVASR